VRQSNKNMKASLLSVIVTQSTCTFLPLIPNFWCNADRPASSVSNSSLRFPLLPRYNVNVKSETIRIYSAKTKPMMAAWRWILVSGNKEKAQHTDTHSQAADGEVHGTVGLLCYSKRSKRDARSIQRRAPPRLLWVRQGGYKGLISTLECGERNARGGREPQNQQLSRREIK
jgi:hypothetical protein